MKERDQERGARQLGRAIRERLSYANVMATAAVFITLGGSAWAVAANSIGPKQIKKNAVRAKHIKKNQIKAKHVAKNAVRTPKIRDGAVTEAKLADGVEGLQGPKGDKGDPCLPSNPACVGPAGQDGSPDTAQQVLDKLMTVDGSGSGLDADALDGIDSSQFIQGAGTVLRHQQSVAPGASTQLTTPYSTISYACPNPVSGAGTVTYTNTFGGLARTVLDGSNGVAFAAVGVTPLTLNTQASGDHVSIGAVHGVSPLRTVNADVFSGHEAGFNICSVYIEAIVR
jgi:hypothetical protein